jgi:ATP-dependent DNA helicase DinG
MEFAEILKSIPFYEERPEQIQMAEAVANAISNKQTLICEAGTGIGKTFAYLVPFTEWAKAEKKRVIVSTYTKTLQHQLIDKDIPTLKSILPFEFNAQLALGSENYLCLRRMNKHISEGLFLFDQKGEIEKVIEWEAKTETGIRSELERDGKINIFPDIARIPDLCIGKVCPFRDVCYYQRARKRLWGADIIITNHHLFFANLVNNKMILPRYDGIVFDEAHNLKEAATDYLGMHITNYKVDYFLNEIKRELDTEEIKKAADELKEVNEQFFEEVLQLLDDEKLLRIKKKNIVAHSLSLPLAHLASLIERLLKRVEDEEKRALLERYVIKCNDFDQGIQSFLQQSLGNSVYWIEAEDKRKKPRISLNAAPIDISPYMETLVFEDEMPIVLTSATLTVDKGFEFIEQELGLTNAQNLSLSSPFDYENNTLLYIPLYGPDPRDNRYRDFVRNEVFRILTITEGRALVLFTSFKLMDAVYKDINQELNDTLILKQGDASREELLERIRNSPSVLFGVSTFWQGVDIPGESLLAVILTRLPFEVPDSPIEEARIEYIRECGGNPFWEYQLPQAVMSLRQGFGRLIRRKDDWGLVAILDTRVRTKPYGRTFLNSLPKCKKTSDINKVRAFFDRKTSG